MTFEFYVRYLWPLHRIFVRHRLAKRCSTCAASEKMTSLNSSGVCAECEVLPPRQPKAHRDSQDLTKAISKIFEAHQGRGPRGYDALLLFSGGKDSAYMARRIQQEFPKLRLLAYTIDNGFMSEIAKENVCRLLVQLKLDHIFVRPRKDFYVQLFRYAITHLNSEGGYGTLDFSDGEFMLDTARGIAAEKKIPLILCGYSRYQVQNGLGLSHFESPRKNELSDRTEAAGLSLDKIFSNEDQDRWWKGSAWPEKDVARLLFPLYAWDIEEEEIKKKVYEWGLISGKRQSPILTNHRLIPTIGVVDVHKAGYSSFEKEFCRMIREGKAAKKEWQPIFEFLEYTAKTGLFVRPAVEEGLTELGLSVKDVGIRF